MNEILETKLPDFPDGLFINLIASYLSLMGSLPVWKIGEKFETFLENKEISKMLKWEKNLLETKL